MPAAPRTPTPRRDVQRNRERLVTTAREAFARDGLEVSMDAITKAAGLGTATVYRHFPTKDDLVAAVIAADEPHLEVERDRIRAAGLAPVEALEEWLDMLARKMTAYDGLPAPLREAVDATDTPLGSTCHVLIDATEDFLAPVRDAGLARAGLTGRSLFLATLGIAWAGASTGDDHETRDQLAGVLHAGWAAGPGGSSTPGCD